MINSGDKQLNTFETSVNGTPNAFPLLTDNFHFSNIASRQFFALKPLQNPHRYFHNNGSIKFAICILIVFLNIFEMIGKIFTG